MLLLTADFSPMIRLSLAVVPTYRLWKTKLPTKVNFSGWLLHFGRNTRAPLHHKNIRSLEESYCELCHGVSETAEHIFSACPVAIGVLEQGWHLGSGREPGNPVGDGSGAPPVRMDVMLPLLWQLWKARNALIFDQQTSTPTDVIRRTCRDQEYWACRYGRLKPLVHAWREFLTSIL